MKQRHEKTVLFLCTGNYYRSRYAEVLFNSVAGKMGLPWKASSRGLALERGVNNVGPMAASVVKALEARGLRAVPEFGRFPIQVAVDDFEAAHWIVALKEAEHQPLLQERYPAWAEKVEFWQVDDAPEVLSLIEREVADLAARLIAGGKRRAVRPIAAEAVSSQEKKKRVSEYQGNGFFIVRSP
jgi:protein-tyrosine phosphatase